MDLRIQPPRRPSSTGVAGIVGVARMADKARSHEQGTLGDYLYGNDSGQDKALLEYLRISAEDFEKAAAEMDDPDLSRWVLERSGRSAEEVAAFNRELLGREPATERMKAMLKERVTKFAPDRADIRTAFQSQELDDWGNFREKDLTAGPPRSPYCRDVAGIVGLARMAEKARAWKCRKLGEYNYGDDAGLDPKVLGWLGLSQEEFAEAAYQNPNDVELGAWVLERTKKTPEEIAAFNRQIVQAGPVDDEQRAYLRDVVQKLDPSRTDITGWFKMTDLDDEQSFRVVDLRRRPPRSGYRTDVAGIVGLARMIDKGRAFNSGTLGAYVYGDDSGIDRRVLQFLGVTEQAFAEALKTCPTDADVADWAGRQGSKTPAEIAAFNDDMVRLGPTADRGWAYLKGIVSKLDPSKTETLKTWFEVMDLDDRVTFERLWAGE
ncbi:MAG: DUF5069 domain-containing protein [Candidatus Latescibacteria bacterium]|nr:DUF5069 domain-containing protein [Candidatus Latescibacterota bacterium]